MMYYVYGHIRPDTGVIFYVGKGCKKRAYSCYNRSNHWKNIVNKNNGNFEVKIFNWFIDEETAFYSEIWIISQLFSFGHLTNKTSGGEGVRGWTKEMKEHQRRAAIEYYKNNPQALTEMSKRAKLQFESAEAKKAAETRAKLQIEKYGLPYKMSGEYKLKLWKDENWRKKIIDLQNAGKRTEEARMAKRLIAKKQWSDPKHRSNTMPYWWWLSNVKNQHYWGA